MVSDAKGSPHSCGPGKKPIYDPWLDKHLPILTQSRDMPILDLGCGYGNDSLYLSERGFQSICCDIKSDALENVRRFVPGAQTLQLDIRKGLPFEKQTFRIVLADLCLHYFPWTETERLVKSIEMILEDDGYLLCRLNSVKDLNHGAGQGIQLEKNFYQINELKKRFFDRDQIEALFSEWQIRCISEYQMDRYKKPKILWELAVQKK